MKEVTLENVKIALRAANRGSKRSGIDGALPGVIACVEATAFWLDMTEEEATDFASFIADSGPYGRKQ